MLINAAVRFSIAEPEEFYFENGEGPFYGVIIGISTGIMFIKVRSKLQYNNKHLRYLAVTVRHQGDSLNILADKSFLIVNFVPLAFDNDNHIGDRSIEELVTLTRRFRGQHLIGELSLET